MQKQIIEESTNKTVTLYGNRNKRKIKVTTTCVNEPSKEALTAFNRLLNKKAKDVVNRSVTA